MFESRMVDDRGEPTTRDTDQVDSVWLSAAELGTCRFFPETLAGSLAGFLRGEAPGPVYLGDVD